MPTQVFIVRVTVIFLMASNHGTKERLVLRPGLWRACPWASILGLGFPEHRGIITDDRLSLQTALQPALPVPFSSCSVTRVTCVLAL